MVIRATRRSSRLQVKRVPSFLSYFKTLSIGPPPGIEPATSRSPVKRSTDWASPARPITIKFRIRKESSKPQTNHHCCLRADVSYFLRPGQFREPTNERVKLMKIASREEERKIADVCTQAITIAVCGLVISRLGNLSRHNNMPQEPITPACHE